MRARAALSLLLLAWAASASADEMRDPRTGRAPKGVAAEREVTLSFAEVPAVLRLEPGSTEVLTTHRPAQTIVVGNPAVVEATLTNQNTILLVPRNNGTTNLILFDEEGHEFFRRTIRVGPSSNPILVYSGERVQRYQCEPACNLPPEAAPPPTAVFTTNINGVPAGRGVPTPAAPAAPAGTAAPAAAPAAR